MVSGPLFLAALLALYVYAPKINKLADALAKREVELLRRKK